MRVIVLGGAGDVGSRTVEELAVSKGVEQVTIADRNLVQAGRIADRLKGRGAKVVVHGLDADDHGAAVSAIRGHDVAASALGPFHRFEAKLVSAALEAGVDYASVCDEWDATVEVLSRFDELARRKGRVVLCGLGTSPGFTNVGARLMADELDVVRRVEIYVYQPLDAGGGEAVMRHMLHIMTGDVVVFRGGREASVRACSERRVVEFPRFGRIELWNMGHAEPVTIPRFIEGVREVGFFMGYGRFAHAFVAPARLGLFRSRRLTDLSIRALLAAERLSGASAPAEGAVRIDVWGERDGRHVHRMACGVGQMREATGLSLAVGTMMLGNRELRSRSAGVLAPEACLDPKPFIRAMRERGIVAYEDLGMTRPIE